MQILYCLTKISAFFNLFCVAIISIFIIIVKWLSQNNGLYINIQIIIIMIIMIIIIVLTSVHECMWLSV